MTARLINRPATPSNGNLLTCGSVPPDAFDGSLFNPSSGGLPVVDSGRLVAGDCVLCENWSFLFFDFPRGPFLKFRSPGRVNAKLRLKGSPRKSISGRGRSWTRAFGTGHFTASCICKLLTSLCADPKGCCDSPPVNSPCGLLYAGKLRSREGLERQVVDSRGGAVRGTGLIPSRTLLLVSPSFVAHTCCGLIGPVVLHHSEIASPRFPAGRMPLKQWAVIGPAIRTARPSRANLPRLDKSRFHPRGMPDATARVHHPPYRRRRRMAAANGGAATQAAADWRLVAIRRRRSR